MGTKDIIKQKRIELGLTMKELANKVGVSEATISRWESGNIATMKQTKIALLAQVLGISPAILVSGELSPNSTITDNSSHAPITLTPPEEIHIKKYRQLDDDGKAEIDNMIDFKLKKTETKQKNKSKVFVFDPDEYDAYQDEYIVGYVDQTHPRKTGS